jgi:hypothetical protein
MNRAQRARDSGCMVGKPEAIVTRRVCTIKLLVELAPITGQVSYQHFTFPVTAVLIRHFDVALWLSSSSDGEESSKEKINKCLQLLESPARLVAR